MRSALRRPVPCITHSNRYPMSADPLPLLRKRTPTPPAVTAYLPVDLSSPTLSPSESVRVAVVVDAGWTLDEDDGLDGAADATTVWSGRDFAAFLDLDGREVDDEDRVPSDAIAEEVTRQQAISYVQEIMSAPVTETSLRVVRAARDANDNDNETALGRDPDSLDTASSYVRVRPSAEVAIVQRFLEEIGSSQFTLTMRLYALERYVRADGQTPATEAARTALGLRLSELDHLRDALNELYLEAAAPELSDALAHDGVFTEYLRGVYAWAESVLRALEILNGELRSLSPDWFRMRARITDARDFYLDHLEEEVRGAIEALNRSARASGGSTSSASIIVHDLGNKVEAVIGAARVLLRGVERRFA